MRKPAMKAVKKSARERLLASIHLTVDAACPVNQCAACAEAEARIRRLLREHERELAERAASAAMSEAEAAYRAGSAGEVFWYEAPRNRVHAAILKRSATPKAHATRGKRGAK